MSFGFGISDVITLVELAYATFDGAKRACGEHDELTQEMSSLVTVLDHVQSEISDPDSPINMARGHRRKELENHIEGCLRHVRQMNTILINFNALSDMERGSGSLWQKVRFGNGAVKDIAQIRLKISTYTTAITISLTLLSLGSRGEAERQLSRQRGELRGIIESVNMLVAKLNAASYEGSIWTKCTDDDVGFWRDFRRQLVKRGYRSRVIRSHESLIQAYVRELDSRGVLNGEMRHSESSVNTESDTEDSDLPEVGTDQVDLKVSVQNQDEVSEPRSEKADTSGPSIGQAGWLGEENTGNKARHYQGPTVEDFEQVSEFDQVETEEPARSLNDDGHAEETWQGGENPYHENFSQSTSEITQRVEYIGQLRGEQQQLLQTMSRGEDTANERTSIYKLLPSLANRHHVNLTSISHVDKSQAGDSDRSHLSELQSVIIDNTSATNEISDQDVDTPLDKEALAKARDEAFNALSSDEKKVIITMQDPSGRKYSFPYFLVKTWDGMQYLIEQAFLNIEDIGSRVAKSEYDLINSDGAVIIPHLWETFVEPDMLVTMQVWPPPSPQTDPALSTAQFSALAPWTPPPPPPPPSPPRPSPPRFSPPHPSPPRSSMLPPIPVTKRLRRTSQMPSYKASNQKARRKSIKSLLFWSSSPPKAKSTMSRRPSPQMSYRQYVPSYDCTCWECHYSKIYSQERPSWPSSFASQFKVIYPQDTHSIVEPESLTKATTEYTESISKVEPIFELEGEQIYELE